MSPITTHVLDTRLGKPAVGVKVTLAMKVGDDWREISQGVTNDDGRITDLLQAGALQIGLYRVRFGTGPYFQSTGVAGFYPEVSISFEVADDADHYHVPLLLSPFGYSTYRGS